MIRSAREWKRFYAQERSQLGESGMAGLLDRAPAVELPRQGALIFPHTRLSESGELVAAAALAVIASGCDTVLALGVLHGARESDAALVRSARGGDPEAVNRLRRVHGPDMPADAGHWREEFSLDGFHAFLDLAARRAGRHAPRIVECYPYLVGDRPDDLPGLEELLRLVAGGCAVVATADPIHHGVGYGTPLAQCLPRENPNTVATAKVSIEYGLRLLAQRDYPGFLKQCAEVKSDFRDNGVVAAALLNAPSLVCRIFDMRLVDYAATLEADEPTWVAAALAQITRS